MEGWAGFTDADLKKIKVDNTKTEGRPSRGTRPCSGSGGQRRGMQHKRPLPSKSVTQSSAIPLDESMLLSKTAGKKINESLPVKDKNTCTSNTGTGNTTPQTTNTGSHGHLSSDDTANHSQDGSTKQLSSSSSDAVSNEKGTTEEVVDMVTDENEIFKHEQKSMESFQKQHKMIEEQNKLKREKLSKVIKERAKKAKAESVKLTQLQQDLLKLDQLLTVDVSIIRDKIEDASREFFEAQKRYDRAEKEYIGAKIDLHKKMEAKESLTEHLYTVIYQNEMRKSKKLAELMNKLEMEDGEDMSDMISIEMPHPSLLSPVQLPVGRYGQIGPVNIQTPPPSPIQQQPMKTESDTSKQEACKATNQPIETQSKCKPDGDQPTNTDASAESALEETKEKLTTDSDKPITDEAVNNTDSISQNAVDTKTDTNIKT